MSVGQVPGWLRSLRRYRQLAIITTAGICFLVVAGGVVRLTGSGLGCDDWPNCNDERFIDVSSGHTAIEQLNRLLSGVIGLPTLLLVVAAFRHRDASGQPRAGLRWPAIGVLVTVLANGVVGGIAVRADLHPALVQSHFLLAMLSISFGMIAIHRSAPDTAATASSSSDVGDRSVRRQLSLWVAGLTAAALATGTVVTGAGPHAGEEDVRRFGFDISNVARLHSITVIVTLLVAAGLAWRIRSDGPSAFVSTLSAWMFVGLLQGVVGYTQYFNGVPELLVGVHIALATGLWVLTMRLVTLGTAAEIKKPDREIARAPLQKT
jgi:cytochrome c oxidase assembly protein subunit 15